MTNIRELYNNFIVKLQEFTYTIGATKRIQIMSEHIDIRPGDIILDIGGNTGKITEAYSKKLQRGYCIGAKTQRYRIWKIA
jgi:ubiquinone/menaquinone biosynthesis C-methylase UbiE